MINLISLKIQAKSSRLNQKNTIKIAQSFRNKTFGTSKKSKLTRRLHVIGIFTVWRWWETVICILCSLRIAVTATIVIVVVILYFEWSKLFSSGHNSQRTYTILFTLSKSNGLFQHKYHFNCAFPATFQHCFRFYQNLTLLITPNVHDTKNLSLYRAIAH